MSLRTLWILFLACVVIPGAALAMLLGAIGFARGQDGGWDRSPSAQSDGLPPIQRWCVGNPCRGQTLAQATPDSEWVKQVLRLQVTEFCATVKPPPKALVEGIQAAAQAGNTDAQVALMWLVRIMERYEKNRCGDA